MLLSDAHAVDRRWSRGVSKSSISLPMYKEKFRQKTGLPLLNAAAADDCTDGIDVADTINGLVLSNRLVSLKHDGTCCRPVYVLAALIVLGTSGIRKGR